MRTYTVHANASVPKAEDRVRFVKEGMARWAIFSPVLWFLYHRMWWEAAVYFGLSILIAVAGEALGIGESLIVLLGFGIQLLAAMEANDLRRMALARKGYQPIAIVHGSDEDEAEARFFASWSHTLPEASDTAITSAVLDRSGGGHGSSPRQTGTQAAYTNNKDIVWPKRAREAESQQTAPPGEVLGLFPKPPTLS
jgi:Protein of unknown function (DUF2628)